MVGWYQRSQLIHSELGDGEGLGKRGPCLQQAFNAGYLQIRVILREKCSSESGPNHGEYIP